jgi:hypothetical protein
VRDSSTVQHRQAGIPTAGESAEPAEAAAEQEQVEDRPLAPSTLDCRDELGAGQPPTTP